MSSSSVTSDPTTGDPVVGGNITIADAQQIPFYALDDQMYLFIGRVSQWTPEDTASGIPDPNINENAPPPPVDSM